MRKLKLDKKGLSPMVAVIVTLTLVLVLGAIIAGTLSGAPRPVMPATTALNLVGEYGANPAAGDTKFILRHEYGSVISDAMVIDPVEWDLLFIFQNAESTRFKDMVVKLNAETTPMAVMYLASKGEVIVNCLTPDLNLNMNFEEWVWPEAEVELDFVAGDMMVLVPLNPDMFETYRHMRELEAQMQPLRQSIVDHPAYQAIVTLTGSEPDVDELTTDLDMVEFILGYCQMMGLITEEEAADFMELLAEYAPMVQEHQAIASELLEMLLDVGPFRPLQSSDLIQVFWDARDMMLVQYLVQ